MAYTHTMKQNLIELEQRASAMQDDEIRNFCQLEVTLLAQMLGYVSTLSVSDKVRGEAAMRANCRKTF